MTEMKSMLGRLIGEDIDMAYSPNPALGKVRADPGQIEQVLMNLAVNARDAMPTGGHLTIEAHNVNLDDAYVRQHPDVRRGAYVRLAVSDSGCGMDERTQARIFEPFFTTKEVGKGTGLGLATVYGIVKQSGGHIEVYSETGRGTTFKIYLPRVREALPSSPSSAAPFVVPRGTETILLVEDEEALRRLSKMALESSGYTVLEAPNGEEALTICQQHATIVHLLLTDVVMPKMSGRQLADLTRALRPNLKVLYLSGYTDDAIIRHGVLESGVSFLQKPFTPSVLNRKVREVLDG
jgi:two-component system, cell cycle sensor histidine kinase and response regulator CckA